jgi:hypothetical protein
VSRKTFVLVRIARCLLFEKWRPGMDARGAPGLPGSWMRPCWLQVPGSEPPEARPAGRF